MGKGRVHRQRQRKAALAQQAQLRKSSGTPAKDQGWSGLRDWCKMQGLPKTKLTLAYFPDTFRGMMATRDIDQGEDIIRVPERLLVTASKVRRLTMARAKADSSSAAGMGGWDLSEHQSLAYWVYTEAELGQRSEWHSYISTLPRDFASVPLFVVAGDCPSNGEAPEATTQGAKWVLSRLPHSMRQKIAEQQSRLFNDWTHTCASLSAANSRPVTSWRLYVWAWLAVNTRCIHLGRQSGRGVRASAAATSSAQTDILRPISGDDSIALAPVLDFLNHSGQADVSVRFDEKQKCFSIRTNRPYAKGQEVFISYGPHDNRFMLAEYGFVLAHNPFQFLELDHVVDRWIDTAKAAMSTRKQRQAAMGPSDVDTLVATLKQHGLWGDFTISLDALEPSYRLQAALQLLLQAGQKDMTPKRAISRWERWRRGEVSGTQDSADALLQEWVKAACEGLSSLSSRMLRDLGDKDASSGSAQQPHGVDSLLVHCLRTVWLEIGNIAGRCSA